MGKLTIIGSGNIGFSLAKGLVKSGQYRAEDITLTRRSLAALEEEQALGFGVSVDNREAIQQADVIVLAVLPQQIRKVMQDIADTVQLRQIVVSVASGVSCRDIKDILGEDTRVVRAMPNTAIAIGESIT
jgi:pyrroline-5-carboxylate reductase